MRSKSTAMVHEVVSVSEYSRSAMTPRQTSSRNASWLWSIFGTAAVIVLCVMVLATLTWYVYAGHMTQYYAKYLYRRPEDAQRPITLGESMLLLMRLRSTSAIQ